MSARYRIGRWELDPLDRTLRRDGESKALSPRATDVLMHLAAHAGEVISGSALIQAYWPRAVTSLNAIQKIITELRHALHDGDGDHTYIETVPKRGYRLVTTVTRIEAGAKRSEELTIFSGGEMSALLMPTDPSRLTRSSAIFVERVRREMVARLNQLPNTSQRTQHVGLERAGKSNLADELGVDYVVDFDAQEIDGQTRVIVTISPTSNELPSHQAHLDSPVVLTEVMAQLVDDLAILLDDVDVGRMREWRTRKVRAYRHALEAEQLRTNVNVASFKRAEVCLHQALVEDPAFGYAYELLTSTYYDLGMMAKDAASYEHARQGIKTILARGRLARIDPKYVSFMEQQYRVACLTNPIDAEAFWREELTRNPNNPEALRRYADLLAGAGLVDESERYLRRAIPLDEANRDWYEMDYANLAGVRDDGEAHVRVMKKIIDRFGDYTVTLLGLVERLARMGRFIEAESYLTRLEASDKEGGWAYSAKLRLMAFRGEIPEGSDALKSALAHPLASNITRGHICFVVGDVENGVAYWRDIEPFTLELIWRFKSLMENSYDQSVIENATYQKLLNELRVGRAWPILLLNGVKELEPITGIAATTQIPSKRSRLRSVV
jgi:DNA-binding winged helix-turn-helix (wHTH) protein/tetratricopeptide (TPR) repeat protein